MKSFLKPVTVFILLLISNATLFRKTNPLYKDTTGFVVLELFTAEGCSSCPPADDTVSKLAKDYSENIYVLGFHVDYWNRLGWKDEFSNAAYTQRQQQYGVNFNLNSVYTPQVIINGKSEFVGSDGKKIRTALDNELKSTSNTQIELSAHSGASGLIEVLYKAATTDKNLLNIALVQLYGHNKVKGGENTGKHLKHINIVRDFITTYNKTGVAELHLPANALPKEFIVIAFIQDKINWNILGAKKVDIY
jgi:hypothetical protein